MVQGKRRRFSPVRLHLIISVGVSLHFLHRMNIYVIFSVQLSLNMSTIRFWWRPLRPNRSDRNYVASLEMRYERRGVLSYRVSFIRNLTVGLTLEMSKSWLDYLPSCTRFGSWSVSVVASLQNQFFDVDSVRLWVYTFDGKLSIPIVFVHWHISIFSRKSEALDWSIACYLYVTSIIFVCMQTLISRTCSCFMRDCFF